MLHNKRNFILAVITGLFLLFGSLQAQEKFILAPGADLKVAGTSTLHDWEMVSDQAKGEAKIKLSGNRIESVSGLQVSFQVKSLKSGKGQMDDIAHETLKAEKFPVIRFELKEVQQITNNVIKAAGNLTIAGTTRPVVLTVNYKVNGSTISFSGTHDIKFTDYRVDPPKAMFGTIKTGNELKLIMDVFFKPANPPLN